MCLGFTMGKGYSGKIANNNQNTITLGMPGCVLADECSLIWMNAVRNRLVNEAKNYRPIYVINHILDKL